MADYIAQIDDRVSLSEFLGTNRFVPTGVGSYILRAQSEQGTVLRLNPDIPIDGDCELDPVSPKTEVNLDKHDAIAYADDRFDEADVWFEQAIVRPLAFSFGNILSTQTDEITVYSSYRWDDITLTEVVNNLGAGVELPDLPSLPTILQPQSGFVVTLQVSTEGSPTLNDTLDFVFDVDTVSVLITGRRIVMFPVRPEAPVKEILEFLTDIMEHLDGSEQRVADRKNPRQEFEFALALDGNTRRFVENLLFDWQSRVFGLPIWHEPSFLTAAATLGQSSISVDDTTLGDYREGGMAIVLTDRFTYDALEIATLGSQTITFTSPLNNSYPAGTEVYPLRTAITTSPLRGSRSLFNNRNMAIKFRVLDNDVGDSFADTSAFNTLSSKVLLDGPNASERDMSDILARRMVEFDNETGAFGISSPWSRGKRTAVKGFIMHSRQDVWDVRRLLHALRGRQISFYMPTFYDEFELTIKLQNGSQTINIVNVGFAQFAQGRMPSRGIIRVIRTNGDILVRNINSAGEVDAENEQIIVDVAWPEDIEIEDIERIEYVELVRADTDRFTFEHYNAIGDASLSFPVKVVFA